MTEHGHAAVEFALAVAVMMLPVALVVSSFGPWSERRVFAESTAAEAARVAVIELNLDPGARVLVGAANGRGYELDTVRLGWCGADPGPAVAPAGVCPMVRGSTVVARVEVWAPLIQTPWGAVGGLWVTATHAEPVDLYRSLE